MDGFVYSVKDRGTSAEEQWKTNTGAPIFGSVNLDKQSFLYVASGTTVHRIDGLTGTRIWARDTGATLQTSPALNSAETLLFVSSTDGQVFAVSSVGTLVWTRATNYKNYSSSPVVGSNGGVETVYVGTVDETGGGYLFALDASSGAINWSFDAEAPIYSTPAVSADGSTVYVASFDNVTGNNWSRVFAVDAATGNKIWPLDNPDPLDPSQLIPDTFFPDGFVSSPALSSDGTQLYIGCYDGKLYSISLATGMVTGSFDTNSGGGSVNNIDSSVGIGSDGAIYFGTFNGEVYALSQ
jgi:outer membrane protein assembly factor BamB